MQGGGSGTGWTPEQIAKSEISGIVDLGTATNIRNSLFYNCHGITSIIGNYVTTIENNGFRGCYENSVSLPELISLGSYGLDGVTGNVYLPKLTTLGAGGYYFSYNQGGTEGTPALNMAIVLPAITTLQGDSFRRCHAKYIDIGQGVSALANRTFYQSSTDTILILRNTNQVVTASATNCILGISSGWKVYVPSALVSSYENDTNWGAKGSIFYAIEGSQFENYYADGTPIT